MAPVHMTLHGFFAAHLMRRQDNTYGNWRDVDEAEAYIVEGWGEGFMLGALLIMAVLTIANMRRGVLLHKMILIELLLAMSHGTFCFMSFQGYGFYLSSTALLLYCSYFTHNVVAWMKIRPFFTGRQTIFGPRVCRWVSRVYLGTLAMTAPVLIFEIFNNFRFFNNFSRLYESVRPYEPLMRDPWWVFSCFTLFHVIRTSYSLNVFRLIGRSPRFGILLAAICLALIFTIMDILASIISTLSITDGINPYWKLALVFKCLTDNIMLDDFKSVLQRLGAMKSDDGTLSKSAITLPNETVSHEARSRYDEEASPNWPREERPHSLSGRTLDENEVLDRFGHGCRKQSMATRAVGRIGMKIHKLPSLAHSSPGSSTDAPPDSGNIEPKIPETQEPTITDQRPPWEDLDFITAISDPAVEKYARKS